MPRHQRLGGNRPDGAFCRAGHARVLGLEFTMTLAQLRLNFFGDQIDRGVHIVFRITRNKPLTGQRQLHGAGEFLLGNTFVITLEIDEGTNHVGIDVIEFFHAMMNVRLEPLGECHLVGGQDQLHTAST